MKKILSICIFLLVSCFSAIAGNIVYPWRSTTAIVKSGQSFEVWFNASTGQTVNSIQLKGPYNTVNVTMSSVNGNWTYDPLSGNAYNRKITVTVPSTAPADRYDLVLNTSSGVETSYGGVKVIKDYKPNYYVMHISDGHLFQVDYDTNVLLKRKDAMIDVANIIDAEIIIETGDNMYSVRNHPEREVAYFIGESTLGTKGMSKASAATFLTPGDHDGFRGNEWQQGTVLENADFFNDYWGLQNHCFKYGNGRFMNLNNAWGLSATSNGVYQYQVDDAKAWLSGAGAGGNFFLTAGHCYDRMHKFINDDQPLSLVLAGDKHHVASSNPWEIFPGGPTISHIANSIANHFEYNLYKIDNVSGTYTKPSGTTARVEVLNSGDQDIPSTWVTNLKLTYANANAGLATSNVATFVNKLGFAITGAKVRFVVPKGNTYTVTGGTITQEFNGTNYYIVDVNTNLNPNSTSTVSINTVTAVAVTGVTLIPSTATLSVGNTQQLTATVAPNNANQSVTWSSSNTAVATVNSNGLVTAVGAGTATITVTTQDGGKTDTSTITVNAVSNDSQTYQAEDATYSGAVVGINQTGYNGTGFIDFVNNSGDYVQWIVNAPTAGDYDLSFRYALPSGGRPLELKVNGTIKVASLDFPATGLWNTWETVTSTQTLVSGNNTVRLTTTGSNGGNIDQLTVIPYLDDCDGLTTWTSASTNTLSYNTTDEKQGAGCLQMVGSATDEFKRSFSTPLNSGASIANGILNFWYYVSDVSKCGTVRVELGSGGAADVNELSWPLSGLVNGWNQISLNTADATQTGTPDMNALNWFRIYNAKTGSITTRLDAIRILDTALAGSSPITTSTEVNLKSDSELLSARIYPNPYKDGILSIDLTGFEKPNDIKIKIVNVAGKTIFEKSYKRSSHIELNLSGQLKESLYFISIDAGNTRVVKKLIVD